MKQWYFHKDHITMHKLNSSDLAKIGTGAVIITLYTICCMKYVTHSIVL